MLGLTYIHDKPRIWESRDIYIYIYIYYNDIYNSIFERRENEWKCKNMTVLWSEYDHPILVTDIVSSLLRRIKWMCKQYSYYSYIDVWVSWYQVLSSSHVCILKLLKHQASTSRCQFTSFVSKIFFPHKLNEKKIWYLEFQ